MKTFEEVKSDIEALPYREYIKLTHWLSERDWQTWDAEIEKDSAAGKLDFLIKEAVAEKSNGTVGGLDHLSGHGETGGRDFSRTSAAETRCRPAKASTSCLEHASVGRNDDQVMPSLAERIDEETKTLEEPQALEVLDFIGHLKHKAGAIKPSDLAANATEGDADWAEFEKLAGAWSGKFNRDACYDRPILC